MDVHVPGYNQLGVLGAGASGTVLLAAHAATGQRVAVKVLSEQLRRDAAFVARFRVEAQVLHDVAGPHVARLVEYVETAQLAAIVMEFVPGTSLATLLREAGRTGPDAALVVLRGSLLGLAEAHARGVVHRDYKPANVIVTPDGGSKLVDFGIAVRAGTRSSDVVGTPLYMAPELWRSAPPSPATDVYAATATFLECLTGRPPFPPGPHLAALRSRHLHAPVPLDGIPGVLRPLARAGMAKEPRDRPDGALQFLEQLHAIADDAYGPHWQRRGAARLADLAAGAAGGGAIGWLAGEDAGPAGAARHTTTVATTTGDRRIPGRDPAGPRPRRSRRSATVAVGAAAVVVTAAVVLGPMLGNPGADGATGTPTTVQTTAQGGAGGAPVDQALAAYDQWRHAAAGRDLGGLCRLTHPGGGFGHPDYPPGTCPTAAEEVRGWLEATALLAERLGPADPATAEVRDEDTIVLHGVGGDPTGRPHLVILRRQDGAWRVAMG